MQFRALGYPTLVFADSDRALDREDAELEGAGIHVVKWAGSVSTETRVFLDLPWSVLADLRRIAEEELGKESVLSHLSTAFEQELDENASLDDLRGALGDEEACRRKLARAASSGQWFKRIDRGERLGEVLAHQLDLNDMIGDMDGTDLKLKLETIRDWAYQG